MMLKARFNGEVLIPVEPVDLPTDRVLELDVRDADEPPRGSGAAILEAMRSMGPVDQDAIDEMMQNIESANQPADYRGCFDDQIDASQPE